MTDSPVPAPRRSAARLATLIAVPVALLVGAISFSVLDGRGAGANPAPVPTETLSVTSSTAVTLAAPSLSPAHATMCLAFIAALPKTLRNLTQRHVSAGPEQNIAYGDPAITAQCGAPEPTVAPTAEIFPMSQVCWYAATGPTATVWTTLDREVPVAVTVPNSYQASGQWANEFSAALVSSMPVIKTHYNC